jgi:2-keto-4-pentenoate hydratase/2-oxohepta-3-ene-1,7-dioic acid hydratase in catechol pathway
MELMVDDQLRQKSDVSLMLYPPDVIVQELREFLVLEDFDIIMTGTPAGVGPVQAGERFHGRVLHGEQELVGGDWRAQ